MKYLLLLTLAFTTRLYTQGNQEYSPRVVEFMNILEEYAQNLNYLPQPDEFYLADEELNNLIKKMYVAIEEDPEGYYNYLAVRYQEYGRAYKEGKINENKPSINNILGLINQKIANKYSKKYHAIITTPYFLRVVIIENTPSVYITKEENYYDQITVTGKVEEIIKGENRFSDGETISFMYLKSTTCSRKYDIGKS